MFHGGEIPHGELTRLVDGVEDVGQVDDELFLFRALPEERRHFCPERRDDVGVDLCETGSLYHLVESTDCVGAGERLHVGKQVFLLRLEQLPIAVVLERFVPEGADVDPGDLRRTEDFPQGPHESTVDPHELLRGDGVSLVEDDPHLLLVLLDDVDDPTELVRNVELVCVEQEDDHVGAISKPRDDPLKIVASMQPLLLSRQDSRCVDERHALQNWIGEVGSLQFAQEGVSKVLEGPELELGVYGKGVPGGYLLVGAVHDGHETIGGRLWADSNPRKVSFEEIADERGFSSGVLTDEKHHRLCFEVSVVHVRGVELAILVRLLERAKLLLVDLLEPVYDVLIHLYLPRLLVTSQPREHGGLSNSRAAHTEENST